MFTKEPISISNAKSLMFDIWLQTWNVVLMLLQGHRGRGAGWATAPPIFKNVRFSEISDFLRKLIYKYNLQTSYPNLYTLYKILATFPIGSTKCNNTALVLNELLILWTKNCKLKDIPRQLMNLLDFVLFIIIGSIKCSFSSLNFEIIEFSILLFIIFDNNALLHGVVGIFIDQGSTWLESTYDNAFLLKKKIFCNSCVFICFLTIK